MNPILLSGLKAYLKNSNLSLKPLLNISKYHPQIVNLEIWDGDKILEIIPLKIGIKNPVIEILKPT